MPLFSQWTSRRTYLVIFSFILMSENTFKEPWWSKKSNRVLVVSTGWSQCL